MQSQDGSAGRLTTHVLDTMSGQPGAGLAHRGFELAERALGLALAHGLQLAADDGADVTAGDGQHVLHRRRGPDALLRTGRRGVPVHVGGVGANLSPAPPLQRHPR